MKRVILLAIALLLTVGCYAKKTFTLWQLESQVNTIGNSYVIRTHSGKIIVMDGGEKGFNTAHFESVIVRGWMEELGIKEHYVACEGLAKIE